MFTPLFICFDVKFCGSFGKNTNILEKFKVLLENTVCFLENNYIVLYYTTYYFKNQVFFIEFFKILLDRMTNICYTVHSAEFVKIF